VTVSGEPEGVLIDVHNHGVPIPSALARRIFDPMKRRESGSSAPAHLGLGLYIAERIVEAHHGWITVVSSVSAGTTFSVYLPRSEFPGLVTTRLGKGGRRSGPGGNRRSAGA
jgi:signal transduction histidine kinase